MGPQAATGLAASRRAARRLASAFRKYWGDPLHSPFPAHESHSSLHYPCAAACPPPGLAASRLFARSRQS
eukprot:scaffold375307_cov38-Prasinocladus_malaysianus.AAC.1